MSVYENDPTIGRRKERAWREVAAIEEAFERGDMDAEGWHRAMMAIIGPATDR